MAGPTAHLLSQTLRSWLGAKGVWVVFLAALLPLILNGAWVLTHQDNVAATDVVWSPEVPAAGEPVEFTGFVQNVGRTHVGEFNVTLRVIVESAFQPGRFETRATTATTVAGLAPGESTTIHLEWTPLQARTFILELHADALDDLAEIDEFNNFLVRAFQVQPGPFREQDIPPPEGTLTGSPGAPAEADAAVTSLTHSPSDLFPDRDVTLRALVENRGPDALEAADVTLLVGTARFVATTPGAEPELIADPATFQDHHTVTIGAGESTTVELDWRTGGQAGTIYWVQAYVNVTDQTHDPEAANNVLSRLVFTDVEIVFPEPPERATIKQFYLEILSILYIPYLIPLIALFYAAGVLSGDRARGNLPYLLTRPVKRWTIPLVRFLAGFAVSAIAVTAGIVVTFGLLFGTPGGDIGFLTTPLLVSLFSLFAYGALFTLVGVLVDRAYLVGVAFIAWETVAFLLNRIRFEAAGAARPLLQDWVLQFTIVQHLSDGLQGYSLDEGVQLLPEGTDALRALAIVAVGSLVALVLAMWAMTRRQFEV